MRPGDRVLIAASDGGYTHTGWDPDASDRVLDLSPFHRSTLHCTEHSLANVLGRPLDDEEHTLLAQLKVDRETGPDPIIDNQVGRTIFKILRTERTVEMKNAKFDTYRASGMEPAPSSNGRSSMSSVTMLGSILLTN